MSSSPGPTHPYLRMESRFRIGTHLYSQITGINYLRKWERGNGGNFTPLWFSDNHVINAAGPAPTPATPTPR